MRIAIISELLEATGNATTARRIAETLVALGHKAVLCNSFALPPDADIDAVVAIHARKSRPATELAAARGLPYALVLGGTDINVDAHSEALLPTLCAAARGAAAVVAFSSQLLSEARKRLGPGAVSHARAVIAPPAVALPPPEAGFSLRDAAGIRDEAPLLFLLPTGLRPVKDPLFLAEAFSSWHVQVAQQQAHGRPWLVIAGPELEPETAAAVRDAVSRLQGVCLLPTPLSQAQLAAALAGQCVAVLNTSHSEGLSQALVEAMRCGCPVLARNIPANAALLADGCGLLFSTPDEAVQHAKQLAADKQLCKTLVAEAAERARSGFSVEAERAGYAKVVALLAAAIRKRKFIQADPEAAAALHEPPEELFERVAARGIVYLDHAGAALYSSKQADAIAKMLHTAVFANPHSGALGTSAIHDRSPAIATAVEVNTARTRVAQWLHAPFATHSIVFTAGCTAALRLVGDCFAWKSGVSRICYLYDCHNSALGVRELACAAGATYVPLSSEEELMSLVAQGGPGPNMLVLPAQCNFSGVRYDLGVIARLRAADRASSPQQDEDAQAHRWFVLLDAAALVPHVELDLTSVQADFTALSFYKVFGMPTGLGALAIRNDAVAVLSGKKYFGGGAVSASLQGCRFHVLREAVSARFEDGTVSFISIAQLASGFDALADAGGLRTIDLHTCCLVRYLARGLLALRHGNNRPVCELAGNHARLLQQGASLEEYARVQGPTIAFNLRRADGSWVGPATVGTLATLCGIQLRVGCMCNPGACNKFLGLSDDEVKANAAAGRVCWSEDMDIVSGKPTGAVRVSLGHATRFEDVDTFLGFISEHFVQPEGAELWPESPPNPPLKLQPLVVSQILVFPIKSCSAFVTDSWEITLTGTLLYDREWAVLGPDGNALSQKQYPRLSQVVPTIDLARGVLRLEAVNFRPLEIPLPRVPVEPPSASAPEAVPLPQPDQQTVPLCSGRRRIAREREEDRAAASLWFTELVGVPCTWVRAAEADKSNKGSFLNSANYLVVSQASFDDLHSRLPEEVRAAIDMINFRPNIVIDGATPYQEDTWKSVQIGPHVLAGWKQCSRCPMTCVDRRTATIGKEPLLTLAKYRSFEGGLMFGCLMNRVASTSPRPWMLSRGMRVIVLEEQPLPKLRQKQPPQPRENVPSVWDSLRAHQQALEAQK